MTELEAGRAERLVPVRGGIALGRYRDVLIALLAFTVLASLPLLTGSKALLDFVIRCSAYGLFATSLNLLVGYTGLTSFGHGMFFGLGAYSFGLLMQRTGVPVPVAFVATLVVTALIAVVIGAICRISSSPITSSAQLVMYRWTWFDKSMPKNAGRGMPPRRP